MKRQALLVYAWVSALGFLTASIVLVMTLFGLDPSDRFPWLWRMKEAALVVMGLNLVFYAAVPLRRLPARAPVPAARRRGALLFNLAVILVALINFVQVYAARGGVPTPAPQERVAAYHTSKQATLRVLAGFCLVLFGVPLSSRYAMSRAVSPSAGDAGR